MHKIGEHRGCQRQVWDHPASGTSETWSYTGRQERHKPDFLLIPEARVLQGRSKARNQPAYKLLSGSCVIHPYCPSHQGCAVQDVIEHAPYEGVLLFTFISDLHPRRVQAV
jgi:hypothetical protein